MTPTGPRSRTERRRLAVAALVVLLAAGTAVPAAALDLLAFWRLPECPLDLSAGGWVDYHVLTIEQGRHLQDDYRVQVAGAGPDGWVLEVLPLVETDAGLVPRPGSGWRIELDPAAVRRDASLADHVRRVVQWEDGVPRELPPDTWRDDPLAAISLRGDFVPRTRREEGPTTRVVGDAELLCRQFALAGAETTRVQLPRGVMLQIHRREIAVAVHDTIPLLGVAYAAEREESVSEFDPPRRRAPPPVRRVEVMELVGFGRDARPVLGGD